MRWYASMRRPDVTQQETHWNNGPRYYVHTCVHTTISQDRDVHGCSFPSDEVKKRGAPDSGFLRYYVNDHVCPYVQTVFRVRRGMRASRGCVLRSCVSRKKSLSSISVRRSQENRKRDDMSLSSMYTMHRSLTFARDKNTWSIHPRISRPR